MQNVTPDAQTYQGSGGNVGGTLGPTDGSDSVQSSTVLTSMADSANTFAYLKAYISGVMSAPPNVQPGAISGAAYGVERIRTIQFASLAATEPTDNASVCLVPYYGIFQWSSIQSRQPDPHYCINTATGQWLNITLSVFGQSGIGTARIQHGTFSQMVTLAGSTSGDIFEAFTTTAPNGTFFGIYAFNALGTGVAADSLYIVDSAQSVPAWAGDTVYFAGQFATNDSGKNYLCTAPGTSASSGGPTGTSTSISDGTVTWRYVTTPGQWVSPLYNARGIKTITTAGPVYGIAALDASGLVPIAQLPTATNGGPIVVSKVVEIVGTGSAGTGLIDATLLPQNYPAAVTAATTTTSDTPASFATVAITTHGRPVMIMLVSDNTGLGFMDINPASPVTALQISVFRNSTQIDGGFSVVGHAAVSATFPPVGLIGYDVPAAGLHTYGLFAASSDDTTTVRVAACQMIVIEL